MDPQRLHPGRQLLADHRCSRSGPFAQVNPGDTVTVDFALVGGDDERTCSRTPTSRSSPPTSTTGCRRRRPRRGCTSRPAEQRVDIYWDDSPESVRG